MARYINEDEFVAWVKEHWCADCQNDNGLRCRACWIDDAIDIVEEAPEADVVPKSEVAREIIEFIKGKIKAMEYHTPGENLDKAIGIVNWILLGVIDDLEKKYTEGAK